MAPSERVWVSSIASFTSAKRTLTDNMVMVMTEKEYLDAERDPKFDDIRITRTINYPDGTPGFRFVRLRYSAAADAIFAFEEEERRKPVIEPVDVGGETWLTSHSLFGAGRIQDLFDADTYTLARGYEANPLVVDLNFPTPRAYTGITFTIGTMDAEVTVRLYADGAVEPKVYTQLYTNAGEDPTLQMEFPDAPPNITRVTFEILDKRALVPHMIHVREIGLR
jgi:hypothetical protein